jgi:hypothetical protein
MVVPSRQYSAKDLPGNLSMKERPDNDYSNKDFRTELLEREALAKNPDHKKHELIDPDTNESMKKKIDLISGLEPEIRKMVKSNEETAVVKTQKYVNPFPQDADADSDEEAAKDEIKSHKSEKAEQYDDADADDKDDDDESDDDSDNELLFEEYERIKKQREEDEKRKVEN